MPMARATPRRRRCPRRRQPTRSHRRGGGTGLHRADTAAGFSLARVLAAVRAEARERGLRDAALDREVVAGMGRVVRGLNLLYAERATAREYAARARIERVGDWRVALLPPGEESAPAGIVLNEEYDVSAEIYRDGTTWARGATPAGARRICADSRRHIPGWFVHSAGFLACWGNRASPENDATAQWGRPRAARNSSLF